MDTQDASEAAALQRGPRRLAGPARPGYWRPASAAPSQVEARRAAAHMALWLGIQSGSILIAGLRPWVLSTRSEPFGLLHHHGGRPPGPRAIQVVLAQCVSELVVDQIASIVGQVRSVRICAQ